MVPSPALLVASIGMFGLNAMGLTAAEWFGGTPVSFAGDAVADDEVA